MAEAYVDKVANELADLALADQEASGDVGIVDEIGKLLGASSQTLQETYLTAVRVRRAEARARDLLARREANGFKKAPPPKAAPLQGLSEEDKKAAEAEIEEKATAAAAQDAAEKAAADADAQETAEIEAEIAAVAARKAADEAAQKAAAEEAKKATAARKAAAAKEAAAKAAEPVPAVVGPWDLEEAGDTPAPAPVAAKPTPEQEAPEPKSPAMPRRVKR